jgi:hypothetical protein
MIETTAQPGSADFPVTHARPGLSTLCSLLAIAAGVPLAMVMLSYRLNAVLVLLVVELQPDPAQVTRALLLAGICAGLAGPLCGWLARVLPPWVVLLGALLVIAIGYWRAQHVSTAHGLYLVRALQGAGAGGLLAGTAALVGAASALTRPYLAGVWAAALIGAGVLASGVAAPDPLGRPDAAGEHGWRDSLQPYPWLLVTASVLALLLAVVSVADRRPRLFPRWIDLAALLPLVAGGTMALVMWTLPQRSGRGVVLTVVVLTVVVLAGGVAATAAVALLLRPRTDQPSADQPGADQPGADQVGGGSTSASRGAVGSATAAVAYVTAGALTATVTGLIGLRAYPPRALPPGSGGSLSDLVTAAAAAGVLAGLVGALLPEVRRRAAILTGLLTAAAGAAALLPASYGAGASLPGAVLLAAGCGLALGAVLRSVGPLATAVAGALAAVAIPTTELARDALLGWRAGAGSRGVTPRDRDGLVAILHRPEVEAQRWWLALLIVLLVGAAAVVALAVRPPHPPAAAQAPQPGPPPGD